MSYIDSEELSRLDCTDSSDSNERSDISIGDSSNSTNQNKRKLITEENVRNKKNRIEVSVDSNVEIEGSDLASDKNPTTDIMLIENLNVVNGHSSLSEIENENLTTNLDPQYPSYVISIIENVEKKKKCQLTPPTTSS